jgi:deoxyadenosine/deoxycytidine kinase
MAIVIDGNIGSGKSTVLNALKDYKKVILEDVDDWKPYLHQFYSDMDKYSLSFQMKVLLHHIKNKDLSTEYVLERSPLSCIHIFGQKLKNDYKISDLDFNLMIDYNKTLGWLPKKLIFINTDPEICLQRIKQRDRAGELIPLEYLKGIDSLYKDLYLNKGIEGIEIFVIDGNQNQDKVLFDVKRNLF